MLEVEKWAQGRNQLFVILAIGHAQAANERCEALRSIKERKLYSHQFPLPNLPEWFPMYRSQKPLLAYKRLISNNSTPTDKMIALFGGLRQADKMIKHDPEQFIEAMRSITPDMVKTAHDDLQEMYSNTFAEIREDIANKSNSPELQTKLDTALVKDELPLSFYFLVYAPCLLFYETSPGKLYRKALNGDSAAIEKLLKVDPLILHDPAIGLQIQKIRLHGKTSEYERIIEAIPKQPGINYKKIVDQRRSFKSDSGAEILTLAKALKVPLKAPDIRALYDALASDYEGTLGDSDIRKPEGFDKSVKDKSAGQIRLQQLEKQK